MNFSSLNLLPQILKNLEKKGYTTPTPIQEKTIPGILEGRDLCAMAQTGTGKTAAFALPLIQRLSEGQKTGGIRALILAPTRELAQQISDSFRVYGYGLHLRQAVVYGGVSKGPQISALRAKPDILIATPGRLLDLMNERFIHLDKIETFVLDEVDRMLDMGFITDIKKVLHKIPAQKQTLFFSATMPSEIRNLADTLLKNPLEIKTTSTVRSADTIKQFVYYIPKAEKKNLLKDILSGETNPHVLVFSRTKRGAERLSETLRDENIAAEAIHGDKTQGARQKALQKFRDKRVSVLIATDVASRGLDITDISHVINFDLPEDPEAYIHRIGRTGRAGAEGTAISFCSPEERYLMKDIMKISGKNIEILPYKPAASAAGEKPSLQTHPVEGGSEDSPGPGRRPERRFERKTYERGSGGNTQRSGNDGRGDRKDFKPRERSGGNWKENRGKDKPYREKRDFQKDKPSAGNVGAGQGERSRGESGFKRDSFPKKREISSRKPQENTGSKDHGFSGNRDEKPRKNYSDNGNQESHFRPRRERNDSPGGKGQHERTRRDHSEKPVRDNQERNGGNEKPIKKEEFTWESLMAGDKTWEKPWPKNEPERKAKPEKQGPPDSREKKKRRNKKTGFQFWMKDKG